MANKKTSKKATVKSREDYDSDAIDAVFVIGTGSQNDNEELRYALRNLEKHCPFIRDVYISGECPNWVDTSIVKHLPWPDKFKHAKDANIIDKLRHACEQPGIAKRILFCSDDQFQTRECTWDDFAPRWLRRYDKADPWYEARNRLWHTRLHKTLDRDRRRREASGLESKNVFYYQPHIWMQIDRDLFIEYAKWSDYEHRDDTIIASGYFNFIDAGGQSNFDHIFISDTQSWPVKETHVAYGDGSFNAAMEYLKEEFDKPCKFERQESDIVDEGTNDLEAEEIIPEPPPSIGETCQETCEKLPKEVLETLNKCKAQAELASKQRAKAIADVNLIKNTQECLRQSVAEHLSVAIAYLNSNSRKPTKLETVLAIGEIRVATRHLLELNYKNEYQMCIDALESAAKRKSTLAPEVFKSVLVNIIR